MAVNLGTAQGHLDLDISKFQSALTQAYASSQAQFKNMEQASGAALQGVGKKMQSAGKSMTTWVTTPILGAGAAVIKTTADFDEGMSKVQALSGATGDDLVKLREKAKEMGAKTKFSATESAEAFQYMALAGWKTGDMLDGISGIMNLAAASGEDLGKVSDIVTDGLTAFGMSAKESSHFADVLAAASANANTDVAGLGEAFKYVGPVAGAFGYSVEDVSTALGLMANAGIKGSSMGTSLRQALVQLTSPTDTAAGYMKEYGISLYDNEGRTKSLMNVMQDLRGAFGNVAQDMNLSEDELNKLNEAVQNDETAWYDYAKGLNIPATAQEKLTALTEMFGARAMPAMLAVIQASDDDFNKLSGAINDATKVFDNATGKTMSYKDALEEFGDEIYTNTDRFKMMSTAEEMAQTMMDNLNGQITIIKSSLEGFAISLGELLMPKLRELAQRIQGALDYFNSLDDAQKMQIIRFAAIAASIGPVLLVLGKLTSGVGTFLTVVGKVPGLMGSAGKGLLALETNLGKLRNGFRMAQAGMAATGAQSSVLGAALGSIMAPIAAIIAAVGVLVAAFVHLWNTNEEFRNNITGIWQSIQDTVGRFTQGIVERINALGFNFESILDVLKAAWDGFCNVLAPVFTTAFQQVQVVLETVFGVLTGILDVFIGLFTGNWEQLWNGLKGIVGSIFNGIKSTIENILNNGILGLLRTFTGNAELTWEDVWNGMKDAVANIGSAIVNGVKDFISNVANFFSQLPGKIAWFLGSAISNVAKWVSQMAQNALNAGRQFLQNVVNFVQQLPGKVGSFLGNAISNVAKWVSQMASNALNAGRQFLSNVVSFVQQLPYKIGQFLGTVIGTVAKWVSNMAQNALNAGRQFLTNVVNFVQQLPGKVASFLSNVISSVAKWVTQMAQNALHAGQQFLQNVVNFFQQLPGKVASFLSNVISNVTSWVSNMAKNATKAGQQFLTNVVNFFQQLPGKVASFLANVVSSVVSWAGQMAQNASQAASSFLSNVVSFLSQLPGQVAGFLASVISTLAGWVGDMGAKGAEAIQSLINAVVNGAAGIPGRMAEIGSNIVQGVWNGIQGAIGWFTSQVNSFFSGIVDGAKGALGIQSPSRVFKEQVGKQIVAGIMQGISSKSKDLQKQINKLDDTILKKQQLLAQNQTRLAESSGKKLSAATIQGYKDRIARYTKEIKSAQKQVTSLRKKQSTLAQKNLIKTAKEYLATQEANNKISLAQEEAYWKLVAKQAKKGSKQRTQALNLAAKAHTAYQQSILDQAKQTMGITEKQVTYTLAQMEGYWNGIAAQMDKGSKQQKEALKYAAQAHKEFVSSVKAVNKEYKEQIAEQMQSFADSAKQIRDSYTEAVNSFAKDLANVNGLFGEFTSETELTTGAMVANIDSQVKALEEYNAEMDKIRALDLPAELVSQLADLGTDGLAQLKVFNTMTEEQLAKYTELWKKRSEIATEEAKNQIDVEPYKKQMQELITETDKALAEVHKTYQDSMKELGLTVNAEMPKVGQDVVNAMQLGFDNSKGSFQSDVNHLVAYVQQQLNAVTAMYRQMSTMTASSSGSSYTASFNVGQNISQGIAAGVANGSTNVKQSVKAVTDAAVQQAKSNLQIKSPSRVFRDQVGMMIPAGMAEGVEDGMPKAMDKVQDAIDDGLDDLSTVALPLSLEDQLRSILRAVKGFYDEIVGGFETAIQSAAELTRGLITEMEQLALIGQPVLATANAGWSYYDASGMANRTNVVRSQAGSTTAPQQTGGDTFIFNSPKAIDEIEAAKQMKRAKQDMAEGF